MMAIIAGVVDLFKSSIFGANHAFKDRGSQNFLLKLFCEPIKKKILWIL